MATDRTIPSRELRNDVARVLRDVAGGARIGVTVRGKQVAELIPPSDDKVWVSRAIVESIVAEAPLDPGFRVDIDRTLGATIDEL